MRKIINIIFLAFIFSIQLYGASLPGINTKKSIVSLPTTIPISNPNEQLSVNEIKVTNFPGGEPTVVFVGDRLDQLSPGHKDNLFRSLWFSRCLNQSCTNSTIPVRILNKYFGCKNNEDKPCKVSSFDVKLNSLGNAVIAFKDLNHHLKILICLDKYCNKIKVTNHLEHRNMIVKSYNENVKLALNSKNIPIITYTTTWRNSFDMSYLRVTSCQDEFCSNFINKTLDISNRKEGGEITFPAIDIFKPEVGFPRIIYRLGSFLYIKNCEDMECIKVNKSRIIVDNTGVIQEGLTSAPDLKVDHKRGDLVMVYRSKFQNTLKITRCHENNCVGGQSKTLVSFEPYMVGAGKTPTLVLDKDGLPSILAGGYFNHLYYIKCKHHTCFKSNRIDIIDFGYLGRDTRWRRAGLGLSISGRPIIARQFMYYKAGNFPKNASVSIFKCGAKTFTE